MKSLNCFFSSYSNISKCSQKLWFEKYSGLWRNLSAKHKHHYQPHSSIQVLDLINTDAENRDMKLSVTALPELLNWSEKYIHALRPLT